MATYELIYFDLRGVAEGVRMCFKAAGKEFKDTRYPIDTTTFARPEMEADKAAGKFVVSMGKVPLLKVTEGSVEHIIPQSKAIERFVAKRFGLMGDSDIEAAKIDAICEHVRDLKDAYQKEKAKGEETTNAWFATGLKEALAKLEACVADGGYAVGTKTSLAGINIYCFLTDYFDRKDEAKAAWSQMPKIAAIVERVEATPEIAKWIAERPNTKM